MSYNTGIPNSSDPRALSQRQILANFQSINSVWAVNHSLLTGDAPQGQHDALTLRPQTGDPTTAANQVALYNKSVSSIPELFFRPPSSATPIQLTYPSLQTTGSQQYSFVAGPFVINFGYIINSAGIPSGYTVTLPGGSSVLFASVTTSGASLLTTTKLPLYAVASNYSTNTFQVYYTPGTLKIPILYYVAIGQ